VSKAVEIEVPGPVVRAVVTVAGVMSYIQRTGWSELGRHGAWHNWTKGENDVGVPLLTKAPDWARCMRQAIIEIAEAEKRAPHLVLADIAAEVVGDAVPPIPIDAPSPID
jgi:hypothetical protein